jgi:hypothetical protein
MATNGHEGPLRRRSGHREMSGSVVGLSLVCHWFVVGLLLVCCWFVVCLLFVCYWFVICLFVIGLLFVCYLLLRVFIEMHGLTGKDGEA